MTTMLILIVLNLGAIHGIYLGDFDYPNACEEAAAEVAQVIASEDLLKDVDAGALICVPKQEA